MLSPFRLIFHRSDRIRTCGIDVPNVARYQLRHTPIVLFSLLYHSLPPLSISDLRKNPFAPPVFPFFRKIHEIRLAIRWGNLVS